MVRAAEKSYNPQKLEARIQQFWDETKAYETTKAYRESGNDFYFIDGPPYTTGHIHLGTAWNKILKDVKLRYLRMNGYNVRDQAGFDMHGLPIEVKVEKELGIKNKREIEELGIDIFVSKCQDFALRFQKSMAKEFKDLGVWLDWENPYFTIRNSYIEGAWWTLKQAHKKDFLEESERVLNWCPRCQTALAEAEVEYWDETDPSIYVKFPLKGKENEYILIWTTTPWTLPANLAVAVHPDFNYAKVEYKKDGGQEDIIYVVEERAEEIGRAGRYKEMKVLQRLKGTELEGLKYEHPLKEKVPFQQEHAGEERMHSVLLADFVTAEMTGVVHIAPGHGPEDFELGKEYDLPPFCPVNQRGEFDSQVPEFEGTFIKSVDPLVVEHLVRKGLLLQIGEITHRFGHCWRCKHAITHRTTTQWFLRVSRISKEMLAEIERIRWVPEWAGSSRFYDWVKNTRDWCITRQRYWGIPMPIWRCENQKCRQIKVVGSEKELSEAEGYTEDMNLHRPWIDALRFSCECGSSMSRVKDVLDVWFDSAVCSWAQLGYPKETEAFERWWPCNWITEAHDQTRGWFYSQLGASMIAFGKSPYDAVLMHGFALDSNGRPMSKSLGNNIEPLELTQKHGIDAFRFYLLVSNPPWDDLPFQMSELINANRTLNILWNVYVFATTYMEMDKFDPSTVSYEGIRSELLVEDAWCLSKLENLKRAVTRYLEGELHHKALRETKEFILNVLSRWYVKLIRDRSWVEGEDSSKTAAYFTLHECLTTLSRLMAPITPHIAEEFYLNLDGSKATVAMEDWPEFHEVRILPELEEAMTIIQEIVDTVMGMRQKAEVNLRWPLTELIIKEAPSAEKEEPKTKKSGVISAAKKLMTILKEQVNVKTIATLPADEEWDRLIIQAKPNFGKIGPVFKGKAREVAQLISRKEADVLKKLLEDEELEFEGTKLLPDMIDFTTTIPGNYLEERLPWGILYLNTSMTKETLQEGFSRELIRRIQDMRKEINLPLEKMVSTYLQLPGDVKKLVTPWKDYISKETRSHLIFTAPSEGFIKEWTIKGNDITIGLVQ